MVIFFLWCGVEDSLAGILILWLSFFYGVV